MTRRELGPTNLGRERTLMERRLAAFFTAAPAGLAILGRELRYVQINETLATMNGQSVAEHVSHPVRELLPALCRPLEV